MPASSPSPVPDETAVAPPVEAPVEAAAEAIAEAPAAQSTPSLPPTGDAAAAESVNDMLDRELHAPAIASGERCWRLPPPR